MGVLAGRIYSNTRGSLGEEIKKWLANKVKGFFAFAENFGLATGEREYQLRKEATGKEVLTGLENYGVAVCDMGTNFWKNK